MKRLNGRHFLMVLSIRMTNFQQTLKMIEEWQPTENEKQWIKDNIGEPLTESQKYDMALRFHLHLTPEEKGEGFKSTKPNMRNTSKSGLPKSFNCLFDESTDLKKLWKTYCKLLWWHHLYNKPVADNWWDYGESLLKKGVKTRKTPLIDYVESVKHRQIILTD